MILSSFQRAMHRNPALAVCGFVLSMSASVLGVVGWKAVDSRNTEMLRAEQDIRNLAHSLAQHAAHTFKAADVAMAGVARLLESRDPVPEGLNEYLKETVRSLPQLQEISVLRSDGTWKYSSLEQLPYGSTEERPNFERHRLQIGEAMLVSGGTLSKVSSRPTIVVSKRINDKFGKFAGVILAAIDYDYLERFYGSFDIGHQGNVCLLSKDFTVLVGWPGGDLGAKSCDTDALRDHVSVASVGFYRTVSAVDGAIRYVGFEQHPRYGTMVTVARSEGELLAAWRSDLACDAIVAAILMASVVGMAAVLAGQFRYRARLQAFSAEREERYRLLADNIADIVLVLDREGILRYASKSVRTILGISEQAVVGRNLHDIILDDDKANVVDARSRLKDGSNSCAVRFRVVGADCHLVWLEANFKLARFSKSEPEIVGVLRDITLQKALEDELSIANRQLAQLAQTDGLTGLANRRHFDAFIRETYEQCSVLSLLLIDIDHFKSFNDTLGHQAGDDCIRRIARSAGIVASSANGLAARYGGEEFAIVLPYATEERAVEVANALRSSVSELDIPHPAAKKGRVTISVGVGTKRASISSTVALVRDADTCLYWAKGRGRDCIARAGDLQPEPRTSIVPGAEQECVQGQEHRSTLAQETPRVAGLGSALLLPSGA